MKKNLFVLFIILSYSLSNAQNLTLAQILDVRKKDLGNAEEYLTSKGWEFLEAEEPEFDKMGSATFTYNKDDMSSRAESFLTFLYSDSAQNNRVSIQISKKIKYTEYINSIKSFGCKILSSKVEEGKIVKIYRGATTTFVIKSGTSTNYYEEDTAMWLILVLSNEDFDINFGSE